MFSCLTRNRLVGKPDYILEHGGELIPVEGKSRKLSTAGAYEGEMLQLAAYCLLVKERYGRPVLQWATAVPEPIGRLPFDDRLRAKLHNALRGFARGRWIRRSAPLSYECGAVPRVRLP